MPKMPKKKSKKAKDRKGRYKTVPFDVVLVLVDGLRPRPSVIPVLFSSPH